MYPFRGPATWRCLKGNICISHLRPGILCQKSYLQLVAKCHSPPLKPLPIGPLCRQKGRDLLLLCIILSFKLLFCVNTLYAHVIKQIVTNFSVWHKTFIHIYNTVCKITVDPRQKTKVVSGIVEWWDRAEGHTGYVWVGWQSAEGGGRGVKWKGGRGRGGSFVICISIELPWEVGVNRILWSP